MIYYIYKLILRGDFVITINKQEKSITDTRVASYGILFNDKEQIAVVRHKNWGLILPGGKKEHNEIGSETIKREVLEEIGYEISDLCFFENIEAFYDITSKGKDYYCHLNADIYSGKISDKIQEPIEDDTSLEWYCSKQLIGKLKLDYQNKVLKIFFNNN